MAGTYPFAYSHTGTRVDCRARSSFGCVSAPALRLTALDWQKIIRPAVRWRSGCVFPLDLARPGAPETLSGRSGARFSKPERRFLRHSSLRICTLRSTFKPLRNTAWAHEFRASGFSHSSPHRVKTRFERCSERSFRWQRARQGLGSYPSGPTWHSRQPTWHPEPPTRRPNHPTCPPRRPNLASQGRSKRVPE